MAEPSVEPSSSVEAGERRSLAGWGGTQPTVARLASVGDAAEIAAAVRAAGARGVLARGLGRAYGDAAQNGGGTVLSLTGQRPRLQLDAARGEVTAWGGTSMDDVMRQLVPRGWFVPVTAGTRHVTIGGALAADIHGKNHHLEGSFANHVSSVRLILADGSDRVITPDGDGPLFWATAGGMGLTGVDRRVHVPTHPGRDQPHPGRRRARAATWKTCWPA